MPVVVAVGLVIPSIVWAAIDRSIWPWDPAWYGEVSADLWANFRTDFGNWPKAMADAFGAKPPAIAWFGQFWVPAGRLFGNVSVSLLLSVVASCAAAIVLLYIAVRRFAGDGAALIAALLLGASPLFISMSHEYFVEPIQCVSMVWLLLILASTSRWRPALTLAQLPGPIAFGLLAKLSSPAYQAAPAAGVVLLLLIRTRGKDQNTFKPVAWLDPKVVGSALLSALLVIGTVAWYRVNLQAAIDHYRAASADTGLYGVNRGFATQFPEWVRSLRDVTFIPHLWLGLVVLAVASLALSIRRSGLVRFRDDRVVAAICCVATIVIVLSLFAEQPNQELRYLLPLVPFVAVLAALAIGAAKKRLIVGLAAAILCAQFTVVTFQSFGKLQTASLVSYPLTPPVAKSAFAGELNRVVTATCTPEADYKINMVGAEYPWLNHNTLEMLAIERYAESGKRCYYTALGYAENDPNIAFKRVEDFKSPYYISIDYGNPANPLPPTLQSLIIQADPFNKVNQIVFRRVVTSGLYQRIPGTAREGLVILRLRSKTQ